MEENENSNSNPAVPYVWAAIGALLIVAGLVYVMQIYTTPAPLGKERAEVRRKALAELRADDQQVLFTDSNYIWVDQKKGIVRMPISRAKELFLQMYQKPAKGRADLIAREEKFSFVPPPVAVE